MVGYSKEEIKQEAKRLHEEAHILENGVLKNLPVNFIDEREQGEFVNADSSQLNLEFLLEAINYCVSRDSKRGFVDNLDIGGHKIINTNDAVDNTDVPNFKQMKDGINAMQVNVNTLIEQKHQEVINKFAEYDQKIIDVANVKLSSRTPEQRIYLYKDFKMGEPIAESYDIDNLIGKEPPAKYTFNSEDDFSTNFHDTFWLYIGLILPIKADFKIKYKMSYGDLVLADYYKDVFLTETSKQISFSMKVDYKNNHETITGKVKLELEISRLDKDDPIETHFGLNNSVFSGIVKNRPPTYDNEVLLDSFGGKNLIKTQRELNVEVDKKLKALEQRIVALGG